MSRPASSVVPPLKPVTSDASAPAGERQTQARLACRRGRLLGVRVVPFVLAVVTALGGASTARAGWQQQSLPLQASNDRLSTFGGADGTDVVLDQTFADGKSSQLFARAPGSSTFGSSTAVSFTDLGDGALDAHGAFTIVGRNGDNQVMFGYRDAAGTFTTQPAGTLGAGLYYGNLATVAVRADGAAYAVWEVYGSSGGTETETYYGAWRAPGATTFDLADKQVVFTYSTMKSFVDDYDLAAALGADGNVLVAWSTHASDCGLGPCAAETFISTFTPPSHTADGGPVAGSWARRDLSNSFHFSSAASTDGSLVLAWGERDSTGCASAVKWGLWRPQTSTLATGALPLASSVGLTANPAIDPVTGSAAIGVEEFQLAATSSCPAQSAATYLALAPGSSAGFGSPAQEPVGRAAPAFALGNDVLLRVFGVTNPSTNQYSLHAVLGGVDTVLVPDRTAYPAASSAVDGLGRAVVAWVAGSGASSTLEVATNDDTSPDALGPVTPSPTTAAPSAPTTPAPAPIAAGPVFEPTPPAPQPITPPPAPAPMISSPPTFDSQGRSAVDVAQQLICASGAGSCSYLETATTSESSADFRSASGGRAFGARSRTKTIKLGSLKKVVAAGKRVRVKLHLKLPAAIRAKLKHGTRIKVRLTITLRTKAGTKSTIRSLTLRSGTTHRSRA